MARPLGTGAAAVALAGLCLLAVAAAARAGETSSAALWAAYAEHPDTHRNIPNCSYAGYRFGEKPLPTPKVVADVRRCGAAGNGQADDTVAFRKAIAQAAAAGGGAVLVPAGQYKLTGLLVLSDNGVVLRGEGMGRTVLQFATHLTAVLGRRGNRWAWSGGMIWIGPGETFRDGKTLSTRGGGEGWRGRKTLTTVATPARRGDRTITVADASGLRAGDTVLMAWKDPGDKSLLWHIAADASMRKADYGSLPGTTWNWPVQIDKVDGRRVTLHQPLRVDIRPAWKVRMDTLGPHVQEIGVEELTIAFPRHKVMRHLEDLGYNGVYLNRAMHCWVRNVRIVNADVGYGVAACKNVTATGLELSGGQRAHHATACRSGSHDTLIEKFRVDCPVWHGINTEGMGSGNVWRKGVMKHGTFDSHCRMSFASIRTDITLRSDGRPGGARDAGPFLGGRVVHWNIYLSGGKSDWVFGPAYLPSGAIVGGQGAGVFGRQTGLWHLPNGPKGCLVVDHGKKPTPADLYEAQLRLRLGNRN